MPKKESTSAPKKAAKKSAKKPVKKAVKKSAAKKTVKKAAAKSVAPTKKASAKPAAKKAVTETTDAKPKAAANTKVAGSGTKASADDAKSASIVFSFEDVERLMAAKKREPKDEPKKTEKPAKQADPAQPKNVVVEDKPLEHRKLGAASLADILGFNPTEKRKNTDLSGDEVPQKWQKYYKLLIELRVHVRDEIDLHSSETLKHSNRDDSGDLSNYGSHQADAGTDSFDRDFALSLVSNEHEALNEIEDAIQRIKNGTYGICEVTGKPIPAARLTAVPFARYSVEGQAEYEKNLRRKVDRSGSTGLFGDTSDVPKIAADDDDE